MSRLRATYDLTQPVCPSAMVFTVTSPATGAVVISSVTGTSRAARVIVVAGPDDTAAEPALL